VHIIYIYKLHDSLVDIIKCVLVTAAQAIGCNNTADTCITGWHPQKNTTSLQRRLQV